MPMALSSVPAAPKAMKKAAMAMRKKHMLLSGESFLVVFLVVYSGHDYMIKTGSGKTASYTV